MNLRVFLISYVTDGTVAILMSSLFFCIPSNLPRCCGRSGDGTSASLPLIAFPRSAHSALHMQGFVIQQHDENRNKTKATISSLRVSRRAGGNRSLISLFLFPAVVKMEVLNHRPRSGSRLVSCCGRSVTRRQSCSFLIVLSLTKIQFTALGSSTR